MHQVEQNETDGTSRMDDTRCSEFRHAVTPADEQRVIRQFVEALLFEGLVEFQTTPKSAPIYDQSIEFRVGNDHYVCAGTIKAFDRVRIAEGSVKRIRRGRPSAFSISELVAGLQIEPSGKRRLCDELLQTSNLCRWNRDNLTLHLAPRRHLEFAALESAIFEGHQYHPSFKTRTGFTLDDHRKYSPEAGGRFQLEFLAIPSAHVAQNLPGSEADFWRRELGAEVYAELTSRLRSVGHSWKDYSLLVAHPFQLRALRTKGRLRALHPGEFVHLGSAGDEYHATQSLRTLANAAHPAKANLKLPLDVLCTSCRRNFRRHFVCTAPVLSKWLASLVAADPFLREGNRLQLLGEYAAALWLPRGETEAQAPHHELDGLEGMLGVIFRESMPGALGTGEAAVPFTALALVESDDRPFIDEWIDEYGVEAWVERLIEVAVVPIWHMLVHHGVAFEAHAQNLILVHRNGWPERIVLRDFHDDTEYVAAFLRDPVSAPDFSAVDPYFATVPDGEGYRMKSVEDLRQLFMDAVFVFNLVEISFLLERCTGFEESRFWAIVLNQLRAYEQSGITEASRIAEVNCGKPEIIVESLLKKTILCGATWDYFEHRIRNPLESRP